MIGADGGDSSYAMNRALLDGVDSGHYKYTPNPEDPDRSTLEPGPNFGLPRDRPPTWAEIIIDTALEQGGDPK